MSFNIGINLLLWGVNIDSQHRPLFADLKAQGYDWLEIPVVGQADRELAAMRAELDALELGRSASCFMGAEENPIAEEAAVRKAAQLAMRQRIDEAASLGAEILIGGFYQAHKVFSGSAPTAQEWAWSAEFLLASADYAKAQGLRLGLEFLNRFETHLINTSADAKRMVDEVGADNLGVLYDTHHANIEDPAPEQAIGGLAESLFHVHLSESHRGTLGRGQVDWDATFAALARANYSGPLVVEAFGRNVAEVVVAANIWRNAFDSELQLSGDAVGFIQGMLSKHLGLYSV